MKDQIPFTEPADQFRIKGGIAAIGEAASSGLQFDGKSGDVMLSSTNLDGEGTLLMRILLSEELTLKVVLKGESTLCSCLRVQQRAHAYLKVLGPEGAGYFWMSQEPQRALK